MEPPPTVKVDKLPYLRDYELYALWRYLNGRTTGRPVFQFRDLTGPHVSVFSVFMFLMDQFDCWGVTLEKPVFHKDIYLKWCPREYKELQERRVRRQDTSLDSALDKIFENDFNVRELHGLGVPFKLEGILDHIEFDKRLSKKNHAKVAAFFDAYLDDFMADRLGLNDSNVYAFRVQEERTQRMLAESKKKFGESFIVKYMPPGSELSPLERDPYLFAHSIAAFEKLGRIRVDKAWVEDDVSPDDQTGDYKIKLTLLAPRAEAPRPTKPAAAQKPILLEESGKGYIKFYKEGPRIPLGKTTTRKHRLVRALIDPLGTAKNVSVVFEAIKDPRDDVDTRLKDAYTAPTREREIIDYTMKELQKIRGIKGRISLTYHHNGTIVSLNLL